MTLSIRQTLMTAVTRCTLIGALATATPAFALDIRIGYLQFVPDQGPVLSNVIPEPEDAGLRGTEDRKSTRLNSSHVRISYAVFCLKKKKKKDKNVSNQLSKTDTIIS